MESGYGIHSPDVACDAGGAEGGDGCVHALGAEERGAGDQCIGAAGDRERGGPGVDAAVDFDAEAEAVLGAVAGGGFDLGQCLGHEFLAAETRLDGHEEEKVDLAQEGERAVERGGGADGEAGGAAGRADAREGGGEVVARPRGGR